MKDKKWYKVINKIGKIISWTILTILILVGLILVFIFFSSKIAQKKGEFAPLSLYTIISPSMTPNINVYDVVIVKKTNPEKLKIGDVISFYSLNDFFGNTPITHRIIEKYNTQDGLQFGTKGDANGKVDNDLVLQSNIIGKVIFKLPQFGRVQFFLISKGGWFIAILIPALGVIAYDIAKLFKLVKVKKKLTQIKESENEDTPNRDIINTENTNREETINRDIFNPENTINRDINNTENTINRDISNTDTPNNTDTTDTNNQF